MDQDHERKNILEAGRYSNEYYEVGSSRLNEDSSLDGVINKQDLLGNLSQEMDGSGIIYMTARPARSESTEMLQRKSVICSLKDASLSGALSDGDESTGGSSLVLEEESDAGEDDSLRATSTDQLANMPSADPSEIECVVEETSGDESSDDDYLLSDEPYPSQPTSKQYSCSLCTFVVLGGSTDLLEHLQFFHKFAVRGVVHAGSCSGTENGFVSDGNAKEGIKQIKKTFTCCEKRGGCGSVFYSKQSLHSHFMHSKSAGGSCWLVSPSNDQAAPPLACTICPFQVSSRKKMIDHLEEYHKCLRDIDAVMNTFALGCRVCDARFWSVTDRSQHEVSQHAKEASYLMLACYLCPENFSSKVCLKKHVRRNHSAEEQFGDVGFRCRLCHLTFPSFMLVQEHFQKFHTSFLVFRCQKCSLILKTKKTYQVHLKSSQCGLARQECKLCDKILWSKRALAIHYRMKHFNSNRVGFLCRICKKRFDSKSERSQHYMHDHQGDSPFTCSVCNKGFASKSGMYGHRQTHEKTSVSKCEFCGKEFSRRDSYNEHMLIHNGPRHKCPHCNKDFVQRSNLVRHIRIHTGEKPYKCSYCEKTFSDKGACNSHIRVHTREEACGCPYCGQIFSKKQKLKYHIRKHTGEDLVTCELCGKNFTNSHSLKEHRLIHDQRTQLLCSQCGKAFSTAKYLQRHIVMIHESVVVFKCPLCTRSFNQQARLKTHLMTHTGVKHLQCLLCSKAYSTRKSLRHHLMNVHSMTIEHPDYKQCFYAMSPEEAGLKIPENQSLPRQPLLKPKTEPQSDDSDLDDKISCSEEDEDDDSCENPPQLVQQEPLCSPFLRQTPFTTIRTKAAMKQLPFSITLTEKRGDNRSSRDQSQEASKKAVKHSQKNRRATARSGIALGVKFSNDCFLGDSSDSSSEQSEALQLKCVDSSSKAQFYKNKPKILSSDKSQIENLSKAKLKGNKFKNVVGQEILGSSNQCKTVKQNSSKSPKSNRRARYKSQTPKKHSVCEEGEQKETLP